MTLEFVVYRSLLNEKNFFFSSFIVVIVKKSVALFFFYFYFFHHSTIHLYINKITVTLTTDSLTHTHTLAHYKWSQKFIEVPKKNKITILLFSGFHHLIYYGKRQQQCQHHMNITDHKYEHY